MHAGGRSEGGEAEMKKQTAPIAVGGSSLLVIFAVLCLTILALFGLSTVQTDRRLAEASRKAVLGYYEADTEAEEILALLRQGTIPEQVTQKGDRYSYQCEISQVQALAVEVQVNGSVYQILRWQLISTTEWETEDGMNVWSGSMD